MRRAFVQMHYQGVNITQEIGEYLTSFRFTEKRDKKADEISFTLSDRDGRWQNAWAPNRGDIVDTVIIYENWFTPGEHLRIDCGRFEVDEDGLASSDSGDLVTVKGMPVSVKSSLSSEKKTRTWQGASLERIGRDIAESASLPLIYQAADLPFARVDQREESDLAFLQRLATEQGCRLRVTGQSIVIFSALRGDSLSPLVITRADGDQLNARRTVTDVYSSVVVTYTDPASGKTMRYSFAPDDAPVTGKTLTLNKRVENEGQAQRVAMAALREKNSKGKSGDWQGQANPLARAGATIRFEGWGVYGGLYGIEEAEHELGGNGAAITRLRLAETLGY